MTVTKMQNVLILLTPTRVPVIVDTMEADGNAKVSCIPMIKYFNVVIY